MWPAVGEEEHESVGQLGPLQVKTALSLIVAPYIRSNVLL